MFPQFTNPVNITASFRHSLDTFLLNRVFYLYLKDIMKIRFSEVKDLIVFIKKKHLYLLPLILLLMIIGLVIIASNASPLPLFLYPLI